MAESFPRRHRGAAVSVLGLVVVAAGWALRLWPGAPASGQNAEPAPALTSAAPTDQSPAAARSDTPDIPRRATTPRARIEPSHEALEVDEAGAPRAIDVPDDDARRSLDREDTGGDAGDEDPSRIDRRSETRTRAGPRPLRERDENGDGQDEDEGDDEDEADDEERDLDEREARNERKTRKKRSSSRRKASRRKSRRDKADTDKADRKPSQPAADNDAKAIAERDAPSAPKKPDKAEDQDDGRVRPGQSLRRVRKKSRTIDKDNPY